MSTTGHYTRYINQYPGWSDNCDTMRGGPIDYHIGAFQVEHNAGNKRAFCHFDNYDKLSHKYGYYICFEVIDYSGKKAIQYILENLEKICPEQRITDQIFKKINFYCRAYTDYQRAIDQGPKESHGASWINYIQNCEAHCICLDGTDKPFTCNHHPAVRCYCHYCQVIETFTQYMTDRYSYQEE